MGSKLRQNLQVAVVFVLCLFAGRKLSCGYSISEEKEPLWKIYFYIKTSKIDGQTVSLFGIFEGHGGFLAIEHLKEHIFENLMKRPKFITDTKLAISECKFFMRQIHAAHSVKVYKSYDAGSFVLIRTWKEKMVLGPSFHQGVGSYINHFATL